VKIGGHFEARPLPSSKDLEPLAASLLPEDVGHVAVRALAEDLLCAAETHRVFFPHAAGERCEFRRRRAASSAGRPLPRTVNPKREELAAFVRLAKEKAVALKRAAELLPDMPMLIGSELMGVIHETIGDGGVDQELERAAVCLVGGSPFPLRRVLLALARWSELQVKWGSQMLKSRRRFANDQLVEWVEQTLVRNGVAPTAYRADNARAGYVSTGNLVTACAVLCDEDPLHAFWVVDTKERISAARRRRSASADSCVVSR
jgi:hypothetical protein